MVRRQLSDSAKHYRENPRSRAKHSRDNGKGGKYEHSKDYKRQHSKARRALGIMGKGGKDVVKGPSGKLTRTESVSTNRGRGGSQRK